MLAGRSSSSWRIWRCFTARCVEQDDFGNLFEDLDLTSSKLGKSENDKNALIVKVSAP